MFRSLLSAGLTALALQGAAQLRVHQVVVLNEGYYNYSSGVQVIPPSVGSYDPSSGTYTERAVIPNARFGGDVKVEGGLVYVTADTLLLKYDANTFALLDQAVVHGIRRIALWNDRILITRGESGGLPHYFEVRDKDTFAPLYALEPADGVPYSCEAVEVLGDKAYISMNNGFEWPPNYTNLVGVVDLTAEALASTIDLGPDGYNPEHLMVSDGNLYAFNNKDYTGSSISRIDPAAGTLVNTIDVALSSGCGTSAVAAGRIYYMEYDVERLARFDLATEQVLDTLDNGLEAYGLLDDPINNVLYVSTTDYVSTGTLYTTDRDGQVLGSAAIGVAAGKMALDIRLSTGVEPHARPSFAVHPNPAVDALTITGLPASGTMGLTITDATGRVVGNEVRASSASFRMDVSALSPGMYLLRVDGGDGVRFVKH